MSEIDDQIKAFLQAGGVIKVIPLGVLCDRESDDFKAAKRNATDDIVKAYIAKKPAEKPAKVPRKKAAVIDKKKPKELSTRQLAQMAGDTTYHGKPCKNGHTKRRTSDKNCIVCDNARVSKLRLSRRKE